jgi:hypothetical protein
MLDTFFVAASPGFLSTPLRENPKALFSATWNEFGAIGRKCALELFIQQAGRDMLSMKILIYK